MKPGSPDRLHRWVYYLTAGFLFAAAVLRTLLQDGPAPASTLLLLLAWLVLLVSEPLLSAVWRPWFNLYLVVQCLLVALLVAESESADFFAILFAVLGMQVMRRLAPRKGAVVFGLFVPVMAVAMLTTYEVSQALIFVVMYTAAALLVSSYSLTTRRAAEAAEHNQRTATELEAANQRLRDYSARLERLAVTRERHRLARDLHDSVTQTIFSMTLTTQSAALLLEKDPPRVAGQLERLAELTRGAMSEMQLLISELRPEKPQKGGLLEALERYAAERAAPHGVDVSLLVEGSGSLSEAEEETLLRIAQEAINNTVKHAGACAATIRLQLSAPPRLEVVDAGRGFDPALRRSSGGRGLSSMRERAAEIGWSFAVESSPGGGTRIAVEGSVDGGTPGMVDGPAGASRSVGVERG